MYACRQCHRYSLPMHAIVRIGKGPRIQYHPGVYLCGTCLRSGLSDDSLRIIHTTDNLLVVRDRRNQYRYDIIKNAVGFITEHENSACDNSHSLYD